MNEVFIGQKVTV